MFGAKYQKRGELRERSPLTGSSILNPSNANKLIIRTAFFLIFILKILANYCNFRSYVKIIHNNYILKHEDNNKEHKIIRLKTQKHRK